MTIPYPINENEDIDFSNEHIWLQLYPFLEGIAKVCVYFLHIPHWQGQEDDIAVDITQETCRKILERAQKVARGEAEPIHSLKRMGSTIVWNYCRDLRRYDGRTFRFSPENLAQIMAEKQPNLCDISVENVYQDCLFRLIASEVKVFPTKQKQAILTDLASRMYFGTQLTPLQAAFLTEGINLQSYQGQLPNQIKSRHDSLVHHAYKRLANSPRLKNYIAHLH